eukprot:TRINITY_DN56779_c0_g1_i1.p1 TRINITY_DN56779_c0_g1~~TRINITY_DN56779_c0_g1_i1.p1  ORF type:complete len:392 (+),score=83.80 TRINITY_DN56779_c0_g1_i1:290-1465(+)
MARLRAVEFYSGCGAWSFAAREALGDQCQVVAAFDVSTTCNSVYESNHGLRPSQKPIERLSIEELDAFNADMWMMSPPCQPHTRQRAKDDGKRDAADARSVSFLHLCDILTTMRSPPKLIALENVVGFESSACAVQWREALSAAYELREWHLDPTQAGVPMHRPRYFALAVRRADGVPPSSNTEQGISTCWPSASADVPVAPPLRPLSDYLELPAALNGTPAGECAWLEPWRVAEKTLESDSAWCFDVVRPDVPGSATACFTHSYGRFVRGTGSVLYVPLHAEGAVQGGSASAEVPLGPDARCAPEEREFGECWRERLNQSGGAMRYFTPVEVARLLGYPASFVLPADMPAKRAWAALGNSLHVGTAAAVLALGAALHRARPGGADADRGG